MNDVVIDLNAEAKLMDLQARLGRLESCWADLAPELTARKERYTKALIAHGGELHRGHVQAIEEVLRIPEDLRTQIKRLHTDIAITRERMSRPHAAAENDEPL